MSTFYTNVPDGPSTRGGSSDKSVQLNEALSKAAASDRTADQAVKEREQFQKDSEYWKKNAIDYKKNAEDKEAQRASAASEAASEKSRADTLSQQLALAQTQNKHLVEKLTASPTPQTRYAPCRDFDRFQIIRGRARRPATWNTIFEWLEPTPPPSVVNL
jgi:hypothetical protein